MSIKRLIILTLLLLSAATVALLLNSNSVPTKPASPVAEKPSGIDKTASPQSSSVKPAPPSVSPQSPAQATRQPSPAAPDPIEDEERTEKEQVDAALAQLNSPDAAERADAAEQLGAYPTREAETALVQVLGSDSEAEVRNAAAQSLGYVEKPSEAALNALFAALEDQNEDVRLSAVSTLEDFLLGSEEGSKRYMKIMAGLEAKAAAHSVPQETREVIREVLEDQKNPEQ
jgi:hypothetical protein